MQPVRQIFIIMSIFVDISALKYGKNVYVYDCENLKKLPISWTL
jgi:hypothetical protein